MNALYALEFIEKWDAYLKKLDKPIQQKIRKKIEKLKIELSARHLKYGLNYFVAEVGQHRICFKANETKRVKRVYFAGTHKDYEKWIKKQ